MRTRPSLVLLAVAAALGVTTSWGRDALASSTGAFLDTIPNGNLNSCLNCHTDMVGPTRNSFGEAVWVSMDYVAADAGGVPVWADLCSGDADGDGQTNGQELDNPCCSWQVGQGFPRSTAISNPSDPVSKSATPEEPSCSPAEDSGGCTVVGSAAGLSGAAVALFLLALARPLRRRGKE